MINLLYHSHTLVPAHLEVLPGLGVLEHDEQVLVALDGVLVDGHGMRLSGPTLHDYCLLTNLRLILWARDYGNHYCYAFPLAELVLVEGAGLDPLHAQMKLVFAAEGEEEQQFTLTLLPLSDLQPATTLLRLAADAARQMATAGLPRHEAGPEMIAVLTEQIFGNADGPLPGTTPYRWPGASAPQALHPGSAYQHNPANLPPEPMYAASRLARSAWDTLRRSLHNADLPFDLNSNSLRELTDAVRAINDLVHTMSSNPAAQQMAMAFLQRRSVESSENSVGTQPAASAVQAATSTEANGRGGVGTQHAPSADQAPIYREIPLRRRGTPAPQPPAAVVAPTERGTIPLRRRVGNPGNQAGRASAPMSGSGDAEE
jgi:hypothetical protein